LLNGVLTTQIYATQRRCDNFNKDYTLVPDGAQSIINVALVQVGRTGNQFGYTESWCADFVSDCAELAGQGDVIPRNGLVTELCNNVILAGGTRIYGIPQKGDLAIVDWSKTGRYSHVELVYDVSGTTIFCVSGNSGKNDVTLHALEYNNPICLAFFRPNYSQNDVDKEEQTITACNVKKTIGNRAFYLKAETSGDGALSYQSNDKEIIAVSKSGKIAIKGVGVATVKIRAAETDRYKKAVKTITVTIRPKYTSISGMRNSSKNKLTVKWKKISGVTRYQIQLSTNPDFSNAITHSYKGEDNTKCILNVKKGKTYYVRVRTYKNSVYSKWSDAKKIKIKK